MAPIRRGRHASPVQPATAASVAPMASTSAGISAAAVPVPPPLASTSAAVTGSPVQAVAPSVHPPQDLGAAGIADRLLSSAKMMDPARDIFYALKF